MLRTPHDQQLAKHQHAQRHNLANEYPQHVDIEHVGLGDRQDDQQDREHVIGRGNADHALRKRVVQNTGHGSESHFLAGL